MRELLLLALLGLALAQLDYSGTYTSNYCSGLGTGSCPSAAAYLCHDTNTGLVQGVYSRVGYIQGYVDSEGNFTGSYFEAGTAGPYFGSEGNAYPNTGTLSLLFVTSGSPVTAAGSSYYFGTSDLHFDFSFERTDITRPSAAQCWSAPAASEPSLNAAWTSSSSVRWPTCVTGGNITIGSYDIGSLEVGISTGPCYLNGSLCTFDFISDRSDAYPMGIGMSRRSGPDDMYAVFWYIPGLSTLDDLTIEKWSQTQLSQSYSFTIDVTAPATQSPFPAGCAKYYYLFGSATAVRASILLVSALLLCMLL